jgi:hypothetical protein
MNQWLLLGAVAAACVAAVVLWLRAKKHAAVLEERFKSILDVDQERERVVRERDAAVRERDENIAKGRAQADALIAQANADAAEVRRQADALREQKNREATEAVRDAEVRKAALLAEISTKKANWETSFTAALAELESVTKQIENYRGEAELQSIALYKPHYEFDTPQQFKDALEKVYERQAAMVKDKTAAFCTEKWVVSGSEAKGRQMTDRNLKLMLRAFNGECDASIAKVRFNNITAMEERLERSFDAINKLGEPNHCEIDTRYFKLKLEELRLTHEHAEKVQADKEEQRRIKEQMREEEIAQRELEKAQKEAEKEEERYEAALEKARAELAKASDIRSAALDEKVAELERRLAEAHANKERAISRAQMTRSGHVYVISNEGSFGETIYKVGMTRRLDPMDRVRELGDASVPFPFDVHAIIFTEDAPGLEGALHKTLADRRVNLVNERKEFFRVTLAEIENAVRSSHGDAEFVRVAVAEEYRKTVALRADRASAPPATAPAPSPVEDAQAHFQAARSRLLADA